MSGAARADSYLTIPSAYGASLGRARWAYGCEAIERWNGTTLVLVEELRPLLEGVFSSPRVPPFVFVLNLFQLMRDGPEARSAGLDKLHSAYAAAARAAGRPRNAGLLVGELCRDLPHAAGPPGWADVAFALGRLRLFGEADAPPAVEEPPLARTEFEDRIEAALARFDPAALLHWLTYGCGPDEAGRRLAEPVDSLPVRVAKLLALIRQRQRLAGAAALAPTLDAALTLPARRRSPDAIPQGGYCDVTTRGEPDRLLPGQFALDPDEFVRRFAERELLYFKREEPHTAEKPGRVIVVDQGARTWGGPRLALAAAALVLMRKDARRVGRVRLAASSIPDLLDVTGPDVAVIADLLEASDLTAHPGDCLDRALRGPDAAEGPRDVILLTHPRALQERGVIAAAGGLRPHDRLFTLSVDDRGRAQLGEWTAGGPVPVRSFRVDLAAAEAARVDGDPALGRLTGPGMGWTGDVEPVGFPFRPGLVAEPKVLGFDADEDWLVVAGRDGILQGLALDGTALEILPRPFLNGIVLKQIDVVLGVPGGVVVGGRMKLAAGDTLLCPVSPGVSTTIVTAGTPIVESSATLGQPTPPLPPAAEVFVAAHYDRETRRVTVHQLGPATQAGQWVAYPALNCVVVRPTSAGPGQMGCALDLATRDRFPGTGMAGPKTRAYAAWTRSGAGKSSPTSLAILTRWSPAEADAGVAYLYVKENSIQVKRADAAWKSFEPKRDGKPLLAGMTIHQALLAGDVLALSISQPQWRGWVLFRGPEGTGLGEITDTPPGSPFAVSGSGGLLARRRRPAGGCSE